MQMTNRITLINKAFTISENSMKNVLLLALSAN
jgi:hypothetical protein